MHLKMPSAEVACKYLPNITDEFKDKSKQRGHRSEEQSDLDPRCLSERFLKRFSRLEKQTTFVVIGA